MFCSLRLRVCSLADFFNNLGIVSLLMLPLSGIPFLMIFMDRTLCGLFVKSLRHFFFPRHIHRKPYPTGCLHGANFQPSLLFDALVSCALESAFEQRLSAIEVLIRIRSMEVRSLECLIVHMNYCTIKVIYV